MIKLGITIGDINGIGPEVIIKALGDERILQHVTPIIYGSSKVMSYHHNIVENIHINFHHISDAQKASNGKVNVVNCWEETVNINLGKVELDGGKYAHIALDKAVQDLKSKTIDGLVTAPINKASMQLSRFNYPGHTEYLTDQFKGDSLMMMVSDALKVALVTNHLPLEEVAKKLSKELISKKLQVLHDSLQGDFGIDKPLIAVLGLNPHAGDEGNIGKQEEELIRPVIIDAKKRGMSVFGPYPADGFFGSSSFKKFDAILAMYHDQGLIPFKALSFGTGTNFTAGLNIVRTSPDHGTAFDIAGQNQADGSAMRASIFKAVDIIRNRMDSYDMRKNALDKKIRPSDLDLEEDEIIEDLS